MTRPPSILVRVIKSTVDPLARALQVQPSAQPAFRATVEAILLAQWGMFSGEQVRFYVPRISPAERSARRARIVAALGAGETATAIARRENVSERWVRRLRGTLQA